MHRGGGGGSTHPTWQEEPIEPEDQEEDNQESVGSTEPADLLAPAIPREELFQFLESTLCSRKKEQLTHDHWGISIKFSTQ